MNKELAVNRDTGKKHSGEAPSEKLVRKFKENPFLPIGRRLGPKIKTGTENVFFQAVEQLLSSWSMAFSSLEERTVKGVRLPIKCRERLQKLTTFCRE